MQYFNQATLSELQTTRSRYTVKEVNNKTRKAIEARITNERTMDDVGQWFARMYGGHMTIDNDTVVFFYRAKKSVYQYVHPTWA